MITEGPDETGLSTDEIRERASQLERELAQVKAELKLTLDSLYQLEYSLEEMNNSVAYRIAGKLFRVEKKLAPEGTRRSNTLRLGYRAVRAIPRLSSPRYVATKLRLYSRRIADRARLAARPYLSLSRRVIGPIGPGVSAISGPPRFANVDQVDVSIIIPVYNHCQETMACLRSIAELTSGPSYEVIVVDDGSSDETPELLASTEGLVAIRNEQNLGFVGSCNRGAEAARGHYLLFLNNDTVVTPGWLGSLVQTFRDIPETGLAGAKLVYPDGRLQEAGGVVWSDASGLNYGKFDDPDHPKYNFAREVDYCSGACLILPRALFESLGGFDSCYKPAYYEDTDLAFKVRHRGHKVIYQPLATVIHHEGVTAGRTVKAGVKTHQLINRAKFRQRWRERLTAHPDSSENLKRFTRGHGTNTPGQGSVLVIDHRLPTPDRDSGSVRMFEMLRAIRKRSHHVAFVPDNMVSNPPYDQRLQGIGIEVVHHPYYRSVDDFLKQYGREFDLVIVARAEIAWRHLMTVKRHCPNAKIVFDTVDLHFLREEREAAVKQDARLLASMRKRKQQELRLARSADLTLVVSPVEKEILERECPGLDVRIISNIIPPVEGLIPGYEARRTIVFIGSFEHPPNVDAVLHFARDVFPIVRGELPDAVFQVIGSSMPPEIQKLSLPGVELMGFVADVRPLFDQARLSVAPLRYGAGVKGKVNQSLSLGVPAVVTSIAAEGMHLVHEENAMIADDAEAFARAVIRVWNDPALWERLSINGRENLREHFSVASAEKRIDDLLQWAGLTAVASHRERTRVHSNA